jgi:hypothetical protein
VLGHCRRLLYARTLFNAPPIFRYPKDDPNRTFLVEFIKIGVGNLAYIGLKTLLELQLTGGQILDGSGGQMLLYDRQQRRYQISQLPPDRYPKTQLPSDFTIRCFESNVHDATTDVLNLSSDYLQSAQHQDHSDIRDGCVSDYIILPSAQAQH